MCARSRRKRRGSLSLISLIAAVIVLQKYGVYSVHIYERDTLHVADLEPPVKPLFPFASELLYAGGHDDLTRRS